MSKYYVHNIFILLLIKEISEKYKSFKAAPEKRTQFWTRISSEIPVKISFLNGEFFTKVLSQEYCHPPKLHPTLPFPHPHPPQAALLQLTKFSSNPKPHSSGAPAQAQMIHFGMWSDFTDQFFGILKWFSSCSSYRHTVIMFFYLQKIMIDDAIVCFWLGF